ncbi:hypothetical protein HCX50_04070 [Microbacterium oxydans]|uniref:hypothetical protein n=1 Tax=Microbacterium sp. B19(2022) TaxID=2914045 RepID=UPI00143089AE|nr:hypothetical protein [Microbacterium sp. B19(2022)]NJI58603.1 hypothetical protein [Microbacterium sp. B19(2022)]
MTEAAPSAQPQTATPDSFTIGDILVSSGGWEQTSIRFYQVVAVMPKTVAIRAISSRVTETVGWAHQMNMPIKDSFIGGPMRRKVQHTGVKPCVLPTSFEVAVPWDGEAKMSTHYA